MQGEAERALRCRPPSLGSMNFDNRSMAQNDESTLMVRDRGMGAQMIRLFLDDPARDGDYSDGIPSPVVAPSACRACGKSADEDPLRSRSDDLPLRHLSSERG